MKKREKREPRENMSHLYELFSKQVARFCADSSRPDCNKNLLVSGVRNLAGMEDSVLDKLDPYQRGARDMIWRAMLGSSRFSSRSSHESADESYLTTGADSPVYPDGRPVPEDQARPLPRDDDVDELRFSRLPSVEEIEANSGGSFYGKGGKEVLAGEERPRQQLAVRFRGGPLPYERRASLRGAGYY
ncbi:Rhythmically expressed gene 5 protein [Harpegnathos saltator]|uniref:Rhythmically expressed gene 5 protein n=1 Tax=Harpegnathos saltator TaxID=610380 RepID=E2BAM9_HARSA|nr:Rhythmically expressed gene 5 protein [Harpegnathos saltator]